MIGRVTALEQDDAHHPQHDLYNLHNDFCKLRNISAYFLALDRARFDLWLLFLQSKKEIMPLSYDDLQVIAENLRKEEKEE
jgi:hypothetical protein